MTSAELAKELRIKESYLRKHWCSIVESYAAKGLTLVRIGRGVSATFGIKSYDDEKIRWESKEDQKLRTRMIYLFLLFFKY